MIGAVNTSTGSPVYSMYLVMAMFVCSGLIVLFAVRANPAVTEHA